MFKRILCQIEQLFPIAVCKPNVFPVISPCHDLEPACRGFAVITEQRLPRSSRYSGHAGANPTSLPCISGKWRRERRPTTRVSAHTELCGPERRKRTLSPAT